MVQPEHGDFYQWIASMGKWVVSIAIGIMGKVSYELTLKRKLSLLEWIAVCGVSVFVGYLCAVWCAHNGWESQSYFLVPIVTLFGEKITAYIADNFRSIMTRIVEIFLKSKK